jgi:hypothetical protein
MTGDFAHLIDEEVIFDFSDGDGLRLSGIDNFPSYNMIL